MDLSKYLSKGFNILKNDTFTYNLSTYPCIVNTYTSRDVKDNGFEVSKEMMLTVPSLSLPALKGKIITLSNYGDWRVITERIGQDYTTLTLISPNQS